MESPRQSLSKDKVFCSQCKYIDDKPGDKGCLSPSNRDFLYDTWYEPSKEGRRSPRDINKNNDCPWFWKSQSSWLYNKD